MKTKEQIKEWLIKNALNKDGEIDLSNINFEGIKINFSGIKAENINNMRQEAKQKIWNDEQKALGIDNEKQIADRISNFSQQAGLIINGYQQSSWRISNAKQKASEINNEEQEANNIYNIKQKETMIIKNEKKESIDNTNKVIDNTNEIKCFFCKKVFEEGQKIYTSTAIGATLLMVDFVPFYCSEKCWKTERK